MLDRRGPERLIGGSGVDRDQCLSDTIVEAFLPQRSDANNAATVGKLLAELRSGAARQDGEKSVKWYRVNRTTGVE